MFIDFLTRVFEENKEAGAIAWKDQTFTYRWMLERVRYWADRIESEGVAQGTVVVLEADFSPNSVALFLALVEAGCILVPLTGSVEANKPEFIEITQGERSFP